MVPKLESGGRESKVAELEEGQLVSFVVELAS